jgi:hypothetical protein
MAFQEMLKKYGFKPYKLKVNQNKEVKCIIYKNEKGVEIHSFGLTPLFGLKEQDKS